MISAKLGAAIDEGDEGDASGVRGRRLAGR